jgi:hypothetical protein
MVRKSEQKTGFTVMIRPSGEYLILIKTVENAAKRLLIT